MSGPSVPEWRPLPRASARLAAAEPALLSRARAAAGGERAAAFLAGFARLPPILDRDVEVYALRLGPCGAIDEHAADEPILPLLLVPRGHGRTRVGGSAGRWHALARGQAMLWPAGALHALEAGDAGLEVRFVPLGRAA